MPLLRAAVLGCGKIAQEHVKAYEQAVDVELVAVADSNGVQLESFDAAGLCTYTDPAALLAEVKVDIVSICTPPVSHAPLAVLALQHGAHVFCEKPLALNAAEGRKMMEAAKKADRLLGVAFCHRFIPAIRRLKELIDRGEIGKPLLYRNQFSGPFLGVEKTWFADPGVSGGGSLMDTTVHSVDLFRYLIGEISDVRALTATSRAQLKVEDNAVMLVKSTDGCLGTLEASWSVAPGTLGIEVRGDKGEVHYDYVNLRWRHADETIWHEEPMYEGCDVRYQAEINHFLSAVRGHSKLELGAEHGLKAVELLHEAYKSAGE